VPGFCAQAAEWVMVMVCLPWQVGAGGSPLGREGDWSQDRAGHPRQYSRGPARTRAWYEGMSRGQPVTYRSSRTSKTPPAIQAALITASCSAQVRTLPVSVTVFPLVSTATSLSSGISA
jgi:hypothetical protein